MTAAHDRPTPRRFIGADSGTGPSIAQALRFAAHGARPKRWPPPTPCRTRDLADLCLEVSHMIALTCARPLRRVLRATREGNEIMTQRRCLLPLLLVTATTIGAGGCASSAPTENSDRELAVLAASPAPSGSGAAPSANPVPGLPGSAGSGKIAPTVGGVTVVPGQLVVKFKSDPLGGIIDDVQSSLQRGR